MINNNTIKQGTPEWLELRWGKIGGTLSEGLLKKSETLFIDILSQRLEEFEYEETFQSDAMERGAELEPFAVEYLEQYYGIKFERSGWLQSEENELLGISPDGISEDETYACECKCFGRKNHLDVLLSQQIPQKNIFQCIHYFTVNPKLEKLYFVAYRPESVKNFTCILTKDSEVNIGTNSKPVIKTIAECVMLSKAEASVLLDRIKQKETELKSF